MSNAEGRHFVISKRLSKAKTSFDIRLADHVFSMIRYSLFCGSLFRSKAYFILLINPINSSNSINPINIRLPKTAGVIHKPNSVSDSGYPGPDNDHSSMDGGRPPSLATYPETRAGSP